MITASAAWVLVMLAGAHMGYVTVPGIASEAACHGLAKTLLAEGVNSGPFASDWHRCVPYERAPR